MTKQDYMNFHEQCCQRMIAITKAKNADYTGTSDNPFANFESVQDRGIVDTERGFLVRMNDKFSRIISFVQKGVLLVKDESIEDTLLDFANYCILLAGYIRSKKDKALPLVAPKHTREMPQVMEEAKSEEEYPDFEPHRNPIY